MVVFCATKVLMNHFNRNHNPINIRLAITVRDKDSLKKRV